MSTPGSRSWDDMVDTLRKAASEIRSVLGRAGSASVGDDAAAARLKEDVSRLERTASELTAKMAAGLRERRAEIDSSLDRERAQRSAEQLKSSLDELAALAGSVTTDIVSATSSTIKQSEPELKNVARTLEDVVSSGTAWIRTAIDLAQERPEKRAPGNRPPLDDF